MVIICLTNDDCLWIDVVKASGRRSRNERPGIPQLFTSVPAFNEAASYLAETTSIFSRCFTDLGSSSFVSTACVAFFWVMEANC